MFRYVGEKIPMSDADVYRCEVCFIFCNGYVCFVLFLTDVTAIRCIINTSRLSICMHYTVSGKKDQIVFCNIFYKTSAILMKFGA